LTCSESLKAPDAATQRITFRGEYISGATDPSNTKCEETNMKKLSLCILPVVIAVAIVSLLITGCDLFGKDTKDEEEVKKYDYMFKNDSSYTVTVQPTDQTTWTGFTLAPGSTKTVTIPDSTIRFTYNQANYILCDNSVAGKLRFYNRTLLGIKNSSIFDLDLINWRGYYFGKDLVWDAILGEYVYGLKPGSIDVREVTPGSGYVYFYFASGGPKYRTTELVSVAAEEQKVFTFLDTTGVIAASILPKETGGTSGTPLLIGVEAVPNTETMRDTQNDEPADQWESFNTQRGPANSEKELFYSTIEGKGE
jgi:hypothetical protein